MAATPPVRPRGRVRVVVGSAELLSFVSLWKAAALAIAELGAGAFFVTGVAWPALGASTPWFVLAACLGSALVRAIDVESWAVFLPGGLIGRTTCAFGPRWGGAAAAAVLAERLLLAALACVVIGHYAAASVSAVLAGRQLPTHLTPDELAAFVATLMVGGLWARARLGLGRKSDAVAKGVLFGIGVVVAVTAWGVRSFLVEPAALLRVSPAALPMGRDALRTILVSLVGLGLALPAIGGGDSLARAAHEFPPPRLQTLRRTALLVVLFALVAIALPSFLFGTLVPAGAHQASVDAPLAGIALSLAGPTWLEAMAELALLLAALLMLAPAARAALVDVAQTLARLATERLLPEGLGSKHHRFGTVARALDVATVATILVAVAGGGRVQWLGRAYAFAIAATLVVKTVTLARLRTLRPGGRAFIAPFNLRTGGSVLPVGLLGAGLLAATVAVAMLASADVPSLATAGLMAALALSLAARARRLEPQSAAAELDELDLLPSQGLSLDQVDARPGNVLVPVRSPHRLAHLGAALQASGDRDVVVMTVRLLGVDVDHESPPDLAGSGPERRLFSSVLAMAERHGRPVRLLIVPAADVFDAVMTTALRLRSSEIYVGESSTLAASEQARLAGEAWERTGKTEDVKVRLVVHHDSGRMDAYHLGAHPPALSPGDLDLIHRLWLDASKAVGPHVHHHDVVRAALRQMEEQLSGPGREDALGAIRQVARPADELAAAVRERDFTRLRDITRNRHASDLAAILTSLGTEEQVVVFRVLPRKDAAAVFEYLERESQEGLLKAMAQEDVASLLNNMAPDDRTMFLEELPAKATRQLLSLLTPAERAVALSLLGYPEKSIGRLMTPNYVRVREHWTIREVLDHIRAHGQDSETLNVIYVVDQQGTLVDDVRIRELLLTSPEARVADLMDRRFVALKATDDQQTAVAAFRQYDRTALPVTDSAGMLIGIVTVDDVLDVAEASATKDIQRIGGSEALDQPYTEIGFWRMIQKRAGWLTALFLGEMLTATAMGAFEAEIARAVVLALFVPLIISSGGNSGSQASTLVVRALALGEVSLRDWWRVARREILAGLSLGAILGSIGFLRISIWSAFSNIYGPHWLLVAITVSLALVGVVLWGTLVGSLLPFALRRLGFDPAASSAPFVATLVDVTGLVIYFSVAILTLRGTLL